MDNSFLTATRIGQYAILQSTDDNSIKLTIRNPALRYLCYTLCAFLYAVSQFAPDRSLIQQISFIFFLCLFTFSFLYFPLNTQLILSPSSFTFGRYKPLIPYGEITAISTTRFLGISTVSIHTFSKNYTVATFLNESHGEELNALIQQYRENGTRADSANEFSKK